MTEKLNREELVELLGALGGEKDEDVLSAAREIYSKISEAGADWNDLLTPDGETHDGAPADEAETEAAAPIAAAPDDAESLSLIERLLQKPDVSESLREELEGYREDISEGELDEMDRKYLRSLYERMKSA